MYVVVEPVVPIYHFCVALATSHLFHSSFTVTPSILFIHQKSSSVVFFPIIEVRVKSLQAIISSISTVTTQGSLFVYSATDCMLAHRAEPLSIVIFIHVLAAAAEFGSVRVSTVVVPPVSEHKRIS